MVLFIWAKQSSQRKKENWREIEGRGREREGRKGEREGRERVKGERGGRETKRMRMTQRDLRSRETDSVV